MKEEKIKKKLNFFKDEKKKIQQKNEIFLNKIYDVYKNKIKENNEKLVKFLKNTNDNT